MPRSEDDVQADLEAAGQRRHSHVIDRDRREADMLEALRDVETAEARIATIDRYIDTLLDERRRMISERQIERATP